MKKKSKTAILVFANKSKKELQKKNCERKLWLDFWMHHEELALVCLFEATWHSQQLGPLHLNWCYNFLCVYHLINALWIIFSVVFAIMQHAITRSCQSWINTYNDHILFVCVFQYLLRVWMNGTTLQWQATFMRPFKRTSWLSFDLRQIVMITEMIYELRCLFITCCCLAT